MSYSRFQDELDNFYKERRERGIAEFYPLELAMLAVRDKWLETGRMGELVAFTVENFDNGDGGEFTPPIESRLLENRDVRLFSRLWKGLIRYRLETLWYYFAKLRKLRPDISAAELDRINLSGFDVTCSNDLRSYVAYQRKFALKGISQLIEGLKLLGDADELIRTSELYQVVVAMQKPAVKRSTDKRKMDEHLFWELIDSARVGGADKFEALDRISDSLEAMKASEIRKFKRLLFEKQKELFTWDHWALAYIARRGCGNDAFDYFRAWAVSKGRDAFEAIRTLQVERLAEIFDEDPQLEDFLYLADKVFEIKTGELMRFSNPSTGKPKGRKWTEDNVQLKYPEFAEILGS